MAENSIKWAVFQDIDSITFIGKEVLSVCNSIHIMFLNIVTLHESIYIAQDSISGDGIECYAGHRTSTMFVFAERSTKSRLFLLTYPEFKIITIIKDEQINKYAALSLTEAEQIVAMSSHPNYIISIWCWRTRRKLVSCDAGTNAIRQIFRCSMSQSLFCHNWSDGLCVWEIVPCYKMFMLLPRRHLGKLPEIVDIVWTNEGNLYCIDKDANLYSIVNDGVGMMAVKEWSPSKGPHIPMIAFFKGGLVVFGPEYLIRHIKKVNKEWVTTWYYTPPVPIIKMISGGLGDTLVLVTVDGDIIKVIYENDSVTTSIVCFWQRSIIQFGIVNPSGDEIVTIDSQNLICLWHALTGNMISRIILEDNIMCMACSPTDPYIAVCGSIKNMYGICLLRGDKQLINISSRSLTTQVLNFVIWLKDGSEIIASCKLAGGVFIMKVINFSYIDVLHFIDTGFVLIDCETVLLEKKYYLIVLAVTDTKNFEKRKMITYDIYTAVKLVSTNNEDTLFNKISFIEPNILLGVSYLPQEVVYMTIQAGVVGQVSIHTVNTFPIDHEISGISIAASSNGWISWGLDGMIVHKLRKVPFKEDFKIIARHRFGENINCVMIDPHKRYAVSLTECSNLAVHSINSHSKASPNIKTKVTVLGMNSIKQNIVDIDEDTWIYTLNCKREAEEATEWADLRNEIEMEFKSIDEDVLLLLEENCVAPLLHQLPLLIFNLNNEAQAQKSKEAADEREKTRIQIEKLIKAQDKVTEWIRIICWDIVDVIGKEIYPIFTDDCVENYAMLPIVNNDRIIASAVEFFRGIEMKQNDNLFCPWEEPINIGSSPSKDEINAKVESKENVAVESDSKTSANNSEAFHKMTGSKAYEYIKILPHAFHQMHINSNLQVKWQTVMTEQTTNMLKQWFNKQFDDMMSVKEKELSTVEEKNARLRVVISELNILAQLRGDDDVIDIIIEDPQWAQEEIPSKLLAVEENEVDVEPYISPSQVVLEVPDLGPKDDFYEQALIVMMDGVLEKLWHEEIKKIIPKPLCMLTKDPEDLTADEIKEVFEYEKNVDFRNQERESYRKILRREYFKLSGLLNDGILRFNQKIKDFYLLKIKVESAIGQEELRLMRLRVESLNRIEGQERCHDLESEISHHESDHERLQSELNDIQNQLTECHLTYENFVARDRTMDKNFKSNFSDVNPIVQDLCYKLFKKRPKWQQRVSMTVGVLNEMAQAALTKERSPFLHPDCVDYLKALDQLDSISNMPPVMDETVWSAMCKLRRSKVDSEIRMRAMCAEIAEVEAASSAWQRRGLTLRNMAHRLRSDMIHHHHRMESKTKNISIQLVVKSGLVEIETSGHEEDFAPAILTKQEDIDVINQQINKAGRYKLKAMRATTSFKKHILLKEWEHAELKMKIRHLQQDLYNLDRIKVTKEVQKYINNKTKSNITPQSIDDDVHATRISFNRQISKQMHVAEELELKIGSAQVQIQKIDDFINKMKFKLSKKRVSEDPNFESKKKEALERRMEILVWRNRLVSEVQKQHTVIIILQTELELQRLKTYPTLSMSKAPK